MRSPFFIVGPTAAGKTEIAIAVAELCGAEIISADAFQVYTGLDLLTAKPTPDDRRRAPHHLVGTVPLAETYNVARYLEEAHRCLADAERRRCPVLVVGGSGMYVKALTHGLSALPPAQPALRAELDVLDHSDLLARLQALDPRAAASIDVCNKRRLVRAVEVCMTTGGRFSDFREAWSAPDMAPGTAGVLLVREKAELDARIEHRVRSMFVHGVIEEVRATDPALVGETASRMIGWRELRAHLDGQVDLRRCAELIEIATRRYAKRQMTWFRGERGFEAISLSGHEDVGFAVDLICRRMKESV